MRSSAGFTPPRVLVLSPSNNSRSSAGLKEDLAVVQSSARGSCLIMFLLQESGETVLHHCARTADHTSLHLVDFLVQNRYQTLVNSRADHQQPQSC